MFTRHDVDVLVTGAGPVGTTAALLLARAGVSVRLVDAADAPPTTSRALASHARTLEIFDELGLLDDVLPFGTKVNAFVRHTEQGPSRMDYDFGDLATRFRHVFMAEQVVVERALRAHCATAGVDVEWGTSLDAFDDDGDGVAATLTVRDGEGGSRRETVRARYLWGCDGGHSVVRKGLDLSLEGESTQTWLFADAVVDVGGGGIDRDGLHWVGVPGSGPVMLFPFPQPGTWRLLDTTGAGDVEDPDEIAAGFAGKLTQALGVPTTVRTPTWISRFTVQQRAVATMGVGRCFVSGDAAHVHSPASGQGMNTGIQDAYNLAWKLAMVLSGDAGAELLDTYGAERVPVGRALLASTAEVNDKATSGRRSASGQDFTARLTRSMSGLAIDYADSPLTVPAAPGDTSEPAPGQRVARLDADAATSPGGLALRARLRALRWTLLVFAGDGAGGPEERVAGAARRPWLDAVIVRSGRDASDPSDPSDPSDAGLAGSGTAAGVPTLPDPDAAVHHALGAHAGTWLLVRPDGYVAARGQLAAGDPADALDALRDAGVGGDGSPATAGLVGVAP